MRRRQAGTSMRAALSNSTSSSSAMRPRSGLSSPAIMLMTLVLPAPDGPNSAVAPLSLANATSSANSPSCFSTWTDEHRQLPCKRCRRAPREPFRGDQRRKRDDDRNDHQLERGGVAARHLRERVDRRRDRLRLARNVGDEGDGGAELAERPREGEHHAGDDAGQRQRQRHGRESPDRIGAERRGCVFEPPVDGLDRQPDRRAPSAETP